MSDARRRALEVLDAADRSEQEDSFCQLSNRTDPGERMTVHRSTGLALVRDGLADAWLGNPHRRVLFIRINDDGRRALQDDNGS